MSYASEVTADSPRVWFRCQESSGSPQDNSGNNLDMVNLGISSYQQTSPILSEPSDYSVASTTDWAYIPDNALLDLADVLTFEVWLKRAAPMATEQYLLAKGFASYAARFDTDNKFKFEKVATGFLAQSTITVTDTNWHHYAATKNGATIKLYIDGVDVTGSVSNSTLADTTDSLNVCQDGAGTRPFNGGIDEFALYSTALSSARVLAHYNAAFGQILLPDADVATAGWTTAPLFSKLNDSSDATVITATSA